MGVCRSSVFKPCKTRWIAMKFSFDIYDPLTKYLNVFSNPLNLPLAPAFAKRNHSGGNVVRDSSII